ncbi:MAG TPA: alpha/beta fold hydrolase [Isosphaeraceae bacterium]|jgi:dienelactone hydrolase|nr:alpha/beta fold hydrolase [Isosphaeraceae bacterium]
MRHAAAAEPDDRLDSLAYALRRYGETPRQLAFRAETAEQARAWQEQARAKLNMLIGPFPAGRIPLEPTFGDEVKGPGFTRRTVTFATRPGMAAFAHLLIPDDRRDGERRPAVLCIPGHGRGADDLVGLDADGKAREHHEGYQHDYALQCVAHGYVTLALEPLGFGHRRDPAARKAGPEQSSCQPSAGAALLLGESMVGWRTWDAIRALDLLAERPEVDAKRLAMMGISGGGTITLYTTAVDDRVKVAVLSCSFCTFRDSIFGLSHCIDNYVPGLLRWFEMADIAALVAPRALFVENGADDPIFPAPGVAEALRDAAVGYKALGAADRLDHETFPDGHVFHGVGAFKKLGEWL